jgi:hypothetical protein
MSAIFLFLAISAKAESKPNIYTATYTTCESLLLRREITETLDKLDLLGLLKIYQARRDQK